ncbi:hypothetical protein [Pelosinus propionicus]|uniref:hypothetical protein n=1 Tax=Pelosinus propionicus TaxID=380084 RepID=UPI001587B671|nr:hypothetical protein [Pelosinus propionicus]
MREEIKTAFKPSRFESSFDFFRKKQTLIRLSHITVFVEYESAIKKRAVSCHRLYERMHYLFGAAALLCVRL